MARVAQLVCQLMTPAGDPLPLYLIFLFASHSCSLPLSRSLAVCKHVNSLAALQHLHFCTLTLCRPGAFNKTTTAAAGGGRAAGGAAGTVEAAATRPEKLLANS